MPVRAFALASFLLPSGYRRRAQNEPGRARRIAATQATGGMNIPMTAALIFPFKATRAQIARLTTTVEMIAIADPPPPRRAERSP